MMTNRLSDVVKFRRDLLFDGAVNIDWFLTDEKRCTRAAEAFVFHGPKYHGVSQEEVGDSHGHQLQDTATFTLNLVRKSYGIVDQPFTLAIAGYGTGKSHLAITLATLLNRKDSKISKRILDNVSKADTKISAEIRAILQEDERPCLVIALNGMKNFDLITEMTQQLLQQVKGQGLVSTPLDELRPRFSQAASLIQMSSERIIGDLIKTCEVNEVEDIFQALSKQDENIYKRVNEFFTTQGMPIRALGGESVREIIDTVCREYCGDGKSFSRLVIFFDEFGRYTEFATIRSQIAGSGVLQDLFEGVQANSDRTCLIGFIQFELNAYVQRIASEYKNEILRYITRYQTADKIYLSINLETLIANLMEKNEPDKYESWFDSEKERKKSQEIQNAIQKWFPLSKFHHLWGDKDQFHTVIRKGCWPLSPYSTWFLFFLAAAGKHLQSRSALALLSDFFKREGNSNFTGNGNWSLVPVDLWTNELEQELLSSEESGQQGSITHSYSSVQAKHGSQLSQRLICILQGVVLVSKLGLKVDSLEEAISALVEITDLKKDILEEGVRTLQEEYNVLDWDERFKQFDIMGEAVPRTQFISFLKQRVASSFDEAGKAMLFASKVSSWCDLLGDIDCDFSEENSITTREWRYMGVTSDLDKLGMHLKLAADRWSNSFAVDEPRGTIIYCYIDQNHSIEAVTPDINKLLRNVSNEQNASELPIIVVLLWDEDGRLGQGLAELTVLEDSISEEDKVRFGNLIGAHQEKTKQIMRSLIENMIKQRNYVTCNKEGLHSNRLGHAGTELFKRIYKNPVPFPFDGFSTARGNAADTCQQLIIELMQGNLDYDAVITKPAKIKNRAVSVLSTSWKAFNKTGSISRNPGHPVVRSIVENWNKEVQDEGNGIVVGQALQQLCLPPYGANIASAGLLFALFLASRLERISVLQNSNQYSISQWMKEDIFKGKFLDLNRLQDVSIISLGDVSSEWENLLCEWEEAESYFERVEYLKRAKELKNRIPIPPALNFRFIHLEKIANDANEALNKMDTNQNDALEKLENGYEKKEIGVLSWGTAALFDLKEQMENEKPLWTEHQVQELQPNIERGRQAIIQIFSDWLARQTPRSDSPEGVGNFKHKMVHLIGGNLKKLELSSLYDDLEKRTNFLIRDAETAAEARQLIREVRFWLGEHSDAFRIIRVAELRGLRSIGEDFSKKLQGMARRIELTDLSDLRTDLSKFLTKLKESESKIVKRASNLWESKIKSEAELEGLLSEVEYLNSAFEGCDVDLEDLQIMKRVIRTYKNALHKLHDNHLTWADFNSLGTSLKKEAEESFADEEIPWPINETFKAIIDIISKSRKQKSQEWMKSIEIEVKSVTSMSTIEANQLHKKTLEPPAILTDQDKKSLSQYTKKIEERLNDLVVEWLIERFRELPASSKKKFLGLASKIVEHS